MTSDGDSYILEIAQNLSECHDSKVVNYLVKLERYLDTLVDDNDISKAIETMHQTNIQNIMLVEIKNDFTYIEPNSWLDGVTLVNLTYRTLSQMIPTNLSEEKIYKNEIFPIFIENILYFSRQLQINYDESLVPNYKGILKSDELLKVFKQTMKIIESFSVRFPDNIMLIFKSNWFVQVFVANDELISIVVTNLVYQILNGNVGCFKKIEDINIEGIGNLRMIILEEIIYHLSISIRIKLGESHLRCLSIILQHDSKLISVLKSRYKGFKLLIIRWTHLTDGSTHEHLPTSSTSLKPYSSYLRNILQLLEQGFVGTIGTGDVAGKMWAIFRIQSWWRGNMTRKRLKKSNKTFAKFHSKYRDRKEQEKITNFNIRMTKEHNYQLEMNRRKLYRAKLEREAEMMQILPKPLFKQYLEKSKNDAAIKIQTKWRSYSAKQKLPARRLENIRERAARKIQFYVKAWLSRRELAATMRVGDREDLDMERDKPDGVGKTYSHLLPPGLNAERKQELVKIQNRWIASHKHEFKSKSDQERQDLAIRAHDSYRQYVHSVPNLRRNELKREALIAQMQRDAKLLLMDSCEELEDFSRLLDENFEGTMKGLDKYNCRVRPYAKRAEQMHDTSMKMLESNAWWRKLELEEKLGFHDDKDDFELECAYPGKSRMEVRH